MNISPSIRVAGRGLRADGTRWSKVITSVEPGWLRKRRLTRIISTLPTRRTPRSYCSNPSNSSNKTRAIRRSTGRLTGRVCWRLRRIRSLIAFAAQLLVIADDALDERVTNHVAPAKLDDGDAVHGFQCPVGLEQSRMAVGRQVNLRFVAGDHGLGSVAEPRQEHEHLFRGRILGFVQDDEGVIERSSAH